MFQTSQLSEKELGYHIISIKHPLNVVSEQYRKLRTNIYYSTFGRDIKVINLTSTNKGEGKTVTILNLAAVYAQAGKRTLIIDMDLRRPKIHRAFNLVNEDGLTDLISAGKDVREAVRHVQKNLYVLPAGKKIPFSAEFLMSDAIRKSVGILREDYDRILIDSPPISAVADAYIISDISDGTALVVASRHTKMDEARTMLASLRKNGANVIGGILTRIDKQDQRYSAGYYYYGED